MQLPRELQHFSRSTLIVVGDSVSAKFFLAGGDAVEEIASVSIPYERRSDKDTAFVDTNSSRVSGMEKKDDEDHLHHVVHAVMERLEAIVREGKADEVWMVMDKELAHAVDAHLGKDVAAKIKRLLPETHTKSHILDVIRSVFEKTPPFLTTA